jgi:hypothetical protein
MLTSEALLDIHERAHRNLKGYLEHCRTLEPGAFDRKLSETSEATVQLQSFGVRPCIVLQDTRSDPDRERSLSSNASDRLLA